MTQGATHLINTLPDPPAPAPVAAPAPTPAVAPTPGLPPHAEPSTEPPPPAPAPLSKTGDGLQAIELSTQ